MTSPIDAPAPISQEIIEAAEYAASQCGYDPDREIFLGCVVHVGWPSPYELALLSEKFGNPPEVFAGGDVISVSWSTWAIPAHFNSPDVSGIIPRFETILVEVSTLMAREVMTYGLGRDYNWLDWRDGLGLAGEPPEHVFAALSNVIRTNGYWATTIRECADGDPAYLETVHPRLRDAVAAVLEEEC